MSALEIIALFSGMICAIVIGDLLSNALTPMILKKVMKPTLPPPQMKLAEILDTVSKLVDLEFIAVVELPNSIKGIELITEFEKAQTEIVKNVMKSFSTTFFLQANAAGVKMDYITTFCTRVTNAKLMGYMKEHNFTLKK